MPGKVTLIIASGPISGREFVFDSHDTFLFGRHSTCHAQLPNDGLVSRHHFILEANPPDARIRDLGSLNGTAVNRVKYGGREPEESPEAAAKRQQQNVDLNDGDVITVGNTRIQVQIHQSPSCAKCGCEIALSSQADGKTRVEQAICESCRAVGIRQADRQPVIEMLCCQRCGVEVEPQEVESHEVEPHEKGVEFFLCEDCSFQQELANQAQPPRPLQPNETHRQSSVGFQLPGYNIERELGKGGMGVVYLAYPIDGPHEPVAVKRMLAQVAVDERIRRQFLREMQVNVGLVHPNIVRFLNSGANGRQFYFVMEYCNGGNLAQFVNGSGGRLDLVQAVPLFMSCLDGLSHAHQSGFVHRDLKPQNLLINESANSQPVVKISDFGLAKSFQLAGLSGMTATGNFGGSWLYMPREQMTNFKYVKPTSDVWSIAATIYWMVTGRPPRDFPRDRDPIEVILHAESIPIRKRRKSLPLKFAEVIDAALATDPAKRFQDAVELRRALESAI